MLKKYLKILSNTLLYYVDKSGNSVFRNYCLFGQTGCKYNAKISKENVGKTLEYRFYLDKRLNWVYFLTPVLLYLIFIHVKFSLFSLIIFELLWLGIVSAARIWCSSIYSSHLALRFGKYELTEFTPDIPIRKEKEFLALFKSKILVILIAIALFFVPALLIKYAIKLQVNSGKRYSQAITLSNFYFSLYPKCERVYDMRALAKAASRDYEGALNDYKSVLSISGKRFKKEDLTRFSNLLYLEKKVSTPNDAIDVFNEYLTKKKLSILETSQMLWVKSIFKIENNILEGIIEEYDELIDSLPKREAKNQFYLSCDRAYMLSIMQEYASAISAYNILISYAEGNQEAYLKEIQQLYAERGFAKQKMGDLQGAKLDFMAADIPEDELKSYEPSYKNQGFVVEKF